MSRNESPYGPVESCRLGRRTVLQCVASAAIGSVASSATAQSDDVLEWGVDLDGRTRASPTVVDDVVYVTTGSRAYAFDAEYGTEQWRSDELGENCNTSPAVVDDAAFVAVDGSVFALDATTGDVAWEADLGSRANASPTVVDGTVYVPVRNESRGRSFPLYALDAETGAERWHHEPEQGFGAVPLAASPTVHDGTVYATDELRYVYALDATDGDGEWRTRIRNPRSSPTVYDGEAGERVFVGSSDGLHALDTETGDVDWSYEAVDSVVESTPTVTDVDELGPTVFVGCEDEHLYALDAETGQREWRFDAGAAIDASPTVTDGGTVYVGVEDVVYGLDAATGAVEFEAEVESRIDYSSPTVVDGTLYVGARYGGPQALRVGTFVESVGSRSQDGTLGHHDRWRHGSQSIDLEFESENEGAGDADEEAEDTDEETVDTDEKESTNEGRVGEEEADENAGEADDGEADDGGDTDEGDAESGAHEDDEAGAADDRTTDQMPGFGLGAALAGLGAGYLLSGQGEDDFEDD